MRTTLDIENDVLQAAKELATRERSTAGKVLSRLARRGLTEGAFVQNREENVKNGVPVLPSRGEVVTLERVRQLMDEGCV